MVDINEVSAKKKEEESQILEVPVIHLLPIVIYT